MGSLNQAPIESIETVSLSITGSPVFWGVQAALSSAPDILLFLSSHLLIGQSGCQPVRMSERCMTPAFPPLQLRQEGLCLPQFPYGERTRRNLPVMFFSVVSYKYINVDTVQKRLILATVSKETDCEKCFTLFVQFLLLLSCMQAVNLTLAVRFWQMLEAPRHPVRTLTALSSLSATGL